MMAMTLRQGARESRRILSPKALRLWRQRTDALNRQSPDVPACKRLLAAAVISGWTLCAQSGSYLVYVKMPDGNVTSFVLSFVPTPDSSGMFEFYQKPFGDIIVHASNVWIMEKTAKAKRGAK